VIRAAHPFDPEGRRSRVPQGISIDVLVRELRRAGFRVTTPDMPWTLAHPFDRSFEEALDEIAGSVGQLRAQGAERVVIVGHSFGGGAVIGFGAWRRGIDGVAALAAGLNPDTPPQVEWLAPSVAKAKGLMAAGHPDTLASFTVFNGSLQGTVYTTPAHYLSFFGPDSRISLHRNLVLWPWGLPLLWIDGSEEAARPRRALMIRPAMLHSGPLARYQVVAAAHDGVADAAAEPVVAWIKCL
jgi:pimeloyl-ACP methyl ester carboxylesterase